MDLTKAIELFEELKRRIDEHDDYLRESEYRTRILLVDPLLRMLGWNVEDFHCVEIEYRTAESVNERADYVLKNDKSKVAIVEAKRLGTAMGWAERRQAKEYADYAGVSQCMLTDGAKWLLYDLNQGRNPETMQPWIEFDIDNDVPEQLILYSLTLWQQWLTPEVGSSPISNLLFGSSDDNNRSETNRDAGESSEQQLLNNPLKDSDNWCTFESKLYPQRTKPDTLKIGDNPEKPVNSWKKAIHEVAFWLADEEILTVNDCPIGTGTYTFIGTEEVNPNGTPLRNPKTLSNGLILQRDYVNTIAQWHKLRNLLGDLGVDPSQIQVSYEPTGKASR